MSATSFDPSKHMRDGNSGRFENMDSGRLEAEAIDLWGEDKGSFESPPRPRSAQDVFDFWRKVEIPDSVVHAVSQKQRLIAHEWGLLRERNVQREFDALPERKKWSNEELDSRKRDAYDTGYGSVKQFSQGITTIAIRAEGMYQSAQYLPPEERQKVLQQKLIFPSRTGEVSYLTPAVIHNGFDFDRLRDEMVNPETRSIAALQRLDERLAELRDSDVGYYAQ